MFHCSMTMDTPELSLSLIICSGCIQYFFWSHREKVIIHLHFTSSLSKNNFEPILSIIALFITKSWACCTISNEHLCVNKKNPLSHWSIIHFNHDFMRLFNLPNHLYEESQTVITEKLLQLLTFNNLKFEISLLKQIKYVL